MADRIGSIAGLRLSDYWELLHGWSLYSDYNEDTDTFAHMHLLCLHSAARAGKKALHGMSVHNGYGLADRAQHWEA